MAQISYEAATRTYPGESSPAVDGLGLEIADGEFLVLVGASGSGKTTAQRMLAGLEKIDSGPIIGGASLWIMNGHPNYQQQAAWEYVKFLMEPEQMAFWHTHTGYFPTSKKALELPDDVAWRKQYPGFQTAIDQLAKTPSSNATKGCSMVVMPQVRAASEVGLETAVPGKATPQAAMDQVATSLPPVIAAYNTAVKK